MKKAFLLLCLLLPAAFSAFAQWPFKGGYLMYYQVEENGDTVFRDVIDPVWVFPKNRRRRNKGKDWRKEYRLVYNFNRVYPYALAGRKMTRQVDSTIAADVSKRAQRSRYIDDVEKELFRLFEKDIRSMTISQGALLMRLIDRECGKSPYDLIKTYESGFVASFWQLVAKLFSQDLKARYDPNGRDANIEQLVQIWEAGHWDAFYYSIFMEKPTRYTLERDRLESEVRPLKKKG
ncbi:MAG: DUF4294 domain-containing protein [Bacteroidales bacterium]|nr:DUF4294 domain-containing protein [Bacteroidales bacterium]